MIIRDLFPPPLTTFGTMAFLAHPLFSVVTGLLGLGLGILLGRKSREREWAQRERLMKETFDRSRCWVKAQVDASGSSS